jgi:AbrB family looped-hinge helix DNA binding protein
MAISSVTVKGQVVIPAKLRKKYGIRKGTKVSISESSDQGGIILRPLSDDPIGASKGMLKGGTSILKAMLRDRKEEAARG